MSSPQAEVTDAEGTSSSITRRPADLFARFIAMVGGAGTIWMFAIMFIIAADIISREVLNIALPGVPEMVGYSLAGSVFLQLANALYCGRFVLAEPLIDALVKKRPFAGAVFHLVFALAGLGVFYLISTGMWGEFLSTYESKLLTDNEGYQLLVWPLRLMIFCGAVLTGVTYAVLAGRALWRMYDEARAFFSAPAGERTPLGWWAVAILAAVIAVFIALPTYEVDRLDVGVIALVGMLVLIFMGIHIAVALITLSFTGVWIMFGAPDIGMKLITLASGEYLRNYFLGVVPLFVMMGLLVKETGIAADTFDVARYGLRKIKGGLGVATVAANAVFAAITGSSIASAAVFTKIATPELLHHGYSPKFSVGVVAGSSVLGMLIPPSLLLIVYGFVAEESVGLLFLAAVIPGIILALAQGLAIIGMAHYWPQFVGRPQDENVEAQSIGGAALKVTPIILLIVAVLGGIYSGFVTPVEAGAVGSLGAIIIALVMRRLTWKTFWNVLVETGHVTVAILFLILAANIYNRMLALSAIPQEMTVLINEMGLGFFGFMMVYIVLVIFLGMFLESISLMLIVLPLVLPIVEAFGGDLIWFGIVTVIAVEMGLLTPPLGIACYVVRSTIDDKRVSLNDIFIGAFPFVLIMLAVTILLIAVPWLSLVFIN